MLNFFSQVVSMCSLSESVSACLLLAMLIFLIILKQNKILACSECNWSNTIHVCFVLEPCYFTDCGFVIFMISRDRNRHLCHESFFSQPRCCWIFLIFFQRQFELFSFSIEKKSLQGVGGESTETTFKKQILSVDIL